MLHQIIIPSASHHTVVVPEAYYGKKVMVTVAALLDEKEESSKDRLMKAAKARAFFNSIQVDMSDFKFNREEANER